MAAGEFVLFGGALKNAFGGTGYDFSASGKIKIALLKTDWTASLSITSFSASCSPYACVLSADAVFRPLLNAMVTVTASAGGYRWFVDADDLTVCATVGVNLSAKFAVIFQSGIDQPIFAAQLSTTHMIANRIGIIFPATGIFNISQSSIVVATT